MNRAQTASRALEGRIMAALRGQRAAREATMVAHLVGVAALTATQRLRSLESKGLATAKRVRHLVLWSVSYPWRQFWYVGPCPMALDPHKGCVPPAACRCRRGA